MKHLNSMLLLIWQMRTAFGSTNDLAMWCPQCKSRTGAMVWTEGKTSMGHQHICAGCGWEGVRVHTGGQTT